MCIPRFPHDQKEKLFIVDDDPSLLEFFTIYFQKKGFAESTSYSTEALAGIIKSKPHCVLLDVMMPQNGRLPTHKNHQE